MSRYKNSPNVSISSRGSFLFQLHYSWFWASLIAQLIKNWPAMQETPEDPLEKEMATHSSLLAWRIPWTEEPGGYSPQWSHSQTQLSDQHTHTYCSPQWPLQSPFPPGLVLNWNEELLPLRSWSLWNEQSLGNACPYTSPLKVLKRYKKWRHKGNVAMLPRNMEILD